MDYSFVLLILGFCISAWSHPSPLIAGGLPVEIQEFPSVVSLHELQDSKYVKTCGGVILTSFFVMTAAKCVTDRPLQVRAGSTYSSSGGTLHDVITTHVHPNYTTTTGVADIAVLGLGNPIYLNSSAVGRAPLPFQDMEANIGMNSFIVGWSSDSLTTEPSEALKFGIVSITDRDQCTSAHDHLPTPTLDSSQICAFNPGVDFCKGGLGSPLFSAGVVIGLATYTVDCGVTSVPSIYTHTSRFTNWILNAASGQPTNAI